MTVYFKKNCPHPRKIPMFDLFHDSAYDETLFLSRMDSTEGKQVRCDIAHTEQQPMAAAQDGGVSGL